MVNMEYNKDLSIVISLFNEEESLTELINWIEKVMVDHGYRYEIILVDDGSTDGSWKIIKNISQNNTFIKGISFRRNYGKSPALFCGFDRAEGDVVITKHDGTRLYTQQLFWNSMTKRIYSNVDTKLVTDTDEVIGEGFESDEAMNEPRFRRWKGKMQVDTEQLRKDMKEDGEKSEEDKEPTVQVNAQGEILKDRNAPEPVDTTRVEKAPDQQRKVKRSRPMMPTAPSTVDTNNPSSKPEVPSAPMEMGKRRMPNDMTK